MNEHTVVIGAENDDDNGRDSGSVYVLPVPTGGWGGSCEPGPLNCIPTLVSEKLTASDGAAGDEFGNSVSIDGDTIAIGAVNNDDAGSNSGSAYVFVRNTGNAVCPETGSIDPWCEQAKLIASDAAAEDQFGESVSVSGDIILIGSHRDDDAGDASGSAYIFTRSGTTWTEQQKLTASDATPLDQFGNSVSVNGQTAVIGAPFNTGGPGFQPGAAYVFTRSGNTWTEQQKLISSDAADDDQFGASVTVENDTAVITAPFDDDMASTTGSAYLFTRSGTTWTEQKKLLASDPSALNRLGSSPGSASVSGNTAVIGAADHNHPGNIGGAAYVFDVGVLPADATPPVITPTIAGTQGNDGWYTSDVTVTWTVTDDESAVFSTTGCGPITINTDTTGTMLTCEATSDGGTNSISVNIKRDATPPTVTATPTPGPNSNGWNNTNVIVSFSGNDATSGNASCDPNTVLSSEGAGQSATGSCTDVAGNSASDTAAGINIDRTPPTVAVLGVTDGANYIEGSVPTASCRTTDVLSGVDVPATLSLIGGPLGDITATCNTGASDMAGNTASASAIYTVITQQTATENLIRVIETLISDGVLNQGQGNGLIRPLENAIRSLEKGKTADTCNQLQDFIDKVNDKSPTPLDVATAAGLIAEAEAIRTAAGCQ